jgi:hypothetical protein
MSIPHVCVPTTHSGAAGDLSPWRKQKTSYDSLTNLEEEEDDARGNDKNMKLPTVIIYDEKLTESHTRRFSAPSGVFVGADTDIDTEAEADIATTFVPRAVDKTDADASIWRPAKSSTAQWSYIHLPGV